MVGPKMLGPQASSYILTSFALNGSWLNCRETPGVPTVIRLLGLGLPSHPLSTPGRLNEIEGL